MSIILLITANVGSVFENIDSGLPVWLNELTNKIQLENPDFVGLHFQETGGKNYKNGSKVIQNFFSAAVETLATAGYNLLHGIVDSDADSKPEFTALSSLYFIRKNCRNHVDLWDFGAKTFVSLDTASSGKLFVGKELKSNSLNQKEKFPQHFFPNCKWSRKGFARARWRIGGTAVDLVNIHLFHDSSNLIAASAFPSPFSQNRQRSLNFMLDKFQNDDLENVPMFIFGDFNFRVNTFDILALLRKETSSSELNSTKATDAAAEIDATSITSDLVVEDKKFSVANQEQRFKEDWKWLRPYDFESTHFETLTEFDINFHPTYPFDEDHPGKFMRTRCPSWCDRILFTHDTKSIISQEHVPDYNLVGSNVCMGDHKPVYLKFHLNPQSSNAEVNPGLDRISSLESSGEAESLEPGISLVSPPPLSRSRFVSFLRDNLSFHLEPPKSRVMKAPSLAPSSTASTASASTNSTHKKCCFLKIRTNSGTGESRSLTGSGGAKKRSKKNILLSAEGSNPLGFDEVKGGAKGKGQNGKTAIPNPEIEILVVTDEESQRKGSSSPPKACMRRGRKSEDGDKVTSKCCFGCHIL